MKNKILYGIVIGFCLISVSIVIAGYDFDNRWHEKEKCNIDGSYCQIDHFCPDEKDNWCNNYPKSKYSVFFYCELYTGIFDYKAGYCNYYQKNFTRNYPFDIHKYDYYSGKPKGRTYDALKETIKKDITNFINLEQEAKKRGSWEDRSGDRGDIYNRKGKGSKGEDK